MRKKLILIVTVALGLVLGGCGEAQKTEEPAMNNEALSIAGCTVNTTVRKTGQYPESFVLSFNGDISGAKVSPQDFHMTGNATYWGSNGKTRGFEASFESATIEGDTLTLVPDNFPEKYFYVKDFKVTCSSNEAFSFSEKDITNTLTPVADDFETIENTEGASFSYHLFTPKKEENMPVVIVFHGYGDTDNLLTYRTAVDWAEPENQEVRPCYVIAPVIDDKTYFVENARAKVFEALKGIVDKMVTEGKVDPDRIYVMGNSFGGMSSIEFAEMYPEDTAKVLALCPALTYGPNAITNLNKMKDVPIWFAHAAGDNTIPVSASQTAVKSLEKLGAKEVHYTEYTTEEMQKAGADPSPDSTYSLHHVELAVMDDAAYKEWLFE